MAPPASGSTAWQSIDRSGLAVSSAGDVNGDGFADMIVGAYGADTMALASGSSYVVFGKAGGFASGRQSLDAQWRHRLPPRWRSGRRPQRQCRLVGGRCQWRRLRRCDRRRLSRRSQWRHSRVQVMWCSARRADLPRCSACRRSMAPPASRSDGELAAGDRSGSSVSPAGDVNGDGFADLIVGAFCADPNGGYFPGSSYVVFGKAGGFASMRQSLDAQWLHRLPPRWRGGR